MRESILVALIGAFAGLLPVAVTTAVAWLEKRGRYNKIRSSIEVAQKRLDFLSAYLRLQKTVVDLERLEEVKTSIASESQSLRYDILRLTELARDEPTAYRERPLIQRLLLAYRPQKISGWIYRLVFYMYVGIVAAGLLDGIRTGEVLTGVDDSGEFSLAFLMGEFIGFFLVAVTPLVAVWYFAQRGEKRAEASKKGADTAVRQVVPTDRPAPSGAPAA